MNYQVQAIVGSCIANIMTTFDQRLRERMVELMVPQEMMRTTQSISFQLTYSAELPAPKQQHDWLEDPDPISIQSDVNATFSLNFIHQPDGPVFSETNSVSEEMPSPVAEHGRTRRYRKTQNKQKQTKIQDQRGVFALSQPPLTEKEMQLEKDIDMIKKRMYHLRKIRKEHEEQERRRLEQSLNRKSPELPKQDFSYDFSGELLMQEKPTLKKSFSILTRGRSSDVIQQQVRKRAKAINDEDESNRDYLMSRQGGESREQKRQLYGNMGKRQVSHLPFIKLNESSKLSENNKTSVNQDTSRFTMKSYQSRGESSFRHFAEIQKQKSERINSLKRSQIISEATEDEVAPLQVTFTPRKQSKRMQKYLSKLVEDKNKKFVTEINKSCNFERLNSPHDYSVHRYYKHNFDEDKRQICENSLADLRLNTSGFREIKLTQ